MDDYEHGYEHGYQHSYQHAWEPFHLNFAGNEVPWLRTTFTHDLLNIFLIRLGTLVPSKTCEYARAVTSEYSTRTKYHLPRTTQRWLGKKWGQIKRDY